MSNPYAFLDESLDARKNNHQFRKLSPIKPLGKGISISKAGKSYINFSSNDYLGLARHPKVTARAQTYVEKYGSGASASRLVCGTFDIHEQLEKNIAASLDREAALIFNSGFQANSSILGTVTDRHSLILADKLSHNSLLQGSLSSRAAFQRFNHNDVNHLEVLLKQALQKKYNRVWIVTESVFSMDGDRSPLRQIAKLSARYDALLFVDDAHAVGVWGEQGLGLAKNVPEIDILLGTCGKAFGSFGAYAACSQKMKNYLINFCPGFIYTTALPPAVIGATQAALDIIPTLEHERKKYHDKIKSLKKTLQKLGFDTGPSSTQIIPIIVGDERQTLELSERLEQHGLWATAIRPPTVPNRSSRVRITLSSRHTKEHLQRLINVLKTWKSD